MRLIDADKLIHALANEFINGKKTLGQVIDEQPTAYTDNKWIPVNERLPETKSNYVECYLVTDGSFCWMAYLTPGKEWLFADCTNCKDKMDWADVTAWMPLPEPYKEDSK